MSIPCFSVSILEAVFGYYSLHWPTEKRAPEALTACELEYAHRAGYRLGPNREWIANTTVLEWRPVRGEHPRCNSAQLVCMPDARSLISLSSERSKS